MFVGRESEAASVRLALRDPARLLVLIGDAGMGKSRLLDESIRAVDDEVRVLVGRCLPLSVDLPLLPVIDVLRNLHAVDGGVVFDAALSQCPDFVRGELARLLPEIGTAPGGEAQRYRQFEAVRHVLAAAGAPALVIDDLHWCDSASLDLLEYLIGRPDSSPVVLAARPLTEMSGRVQQWLARIMRLPLARRLDLGPLGSDEVGSLLAALDWTGTVDDVARIAGRSGGVPYYIEQLAAVGGDQDLPRTLQTTLLTRTAGLSDAARDVLLVLAVAGRPVRDEEMHAACRSHAGDALRELVARGLAAATRDSSGEVRRTPAHALLAEAVRAELTSQELRDLHRRVADAFEAQPDVDADDVARHLARAGDPRREAMFRLRAAEQARRRAAPREAYGHLARVIAIDPDADVLVYLDAYVLARHAGDTEAAAELAERMLVGFEDSADAVVQMQLWHAVGHHRVLRDPAGLEALARAVKIGRPLPATAQYGYALYDLARHLRGRGNAAAAQALGPDLAHVAEECGDSDLAVLVDAELACHALLAGRDDIAEALLIRARSGSPHAIGQGLNAAAMVTYLLLMSGRLAETVAYGQQIVAEREAAGLSAASVTGSLRADVAAAMLEQGRLADAAAALGEATAGRPAPDAAASGELRTMVDIASGRVADAVRYWDRIPALLDYPALLVEAGPTLLTTLVEAGRQEEAVTRGEQMLTTVLEGDEARLAGPIITLVRRAMGDLVEAGTPARQVGARSAKLDAAITSAPVDPFAARTFPVAGAAFGLTDRAERSRINGPADPGSWRAAVDAWRQLDRPWRSAYCGWRGAQAALATPGARPLGVEMLRSAWPEAAGHVPLRAALSELARVARVDLPTPKAALPTARSTFTERESAVLALLAEGMTNAEIGRALYISPKTVSVHVTNILRKLGVRTRVEAVSRAHRSGLLD